MAVLGILAASCAPDSGDGGGLVGAVSSTTTPGVGGTASSVPATSPPEETAAPPIEAPADWDPVVSEPRLLLSEVGFLPAAGEAPFIELANLGAMPAATSGSVIVNDGGEEVVVPAGSPDLAPGETLLVRFDGSSGRDERVIHSVLAGFLDPDGFELLLTGSDGMLLDRVAWGDGFAGAVRPSGGGEIPDPVPGESIGRVPTEVAVSAEVWSSFEPEQVTPGSLNPRPVVSLLLPLDGSIVSGPPILGWYPVAGAVSYSVQIAADPDFTDLVLEASTEAPGLQPSLDAGSYVWRVAAVGADGRDAGFSAPSRITVEGVSGANAVADRLPAGGVPGVETGFRQEAAARLAVPLLAQRKDSGLLEMQSINESGDHAWNVGHGAFDAGDPSDNMNCALASITMVNRYYGGDLTQDRIGYQVLSGKAPGPETDLNYGRGLYRAEGTAALEWAVGGPVTIEVVAGDLETMWRLVVGQIDAGTPVVATRGGPGGYHTMVIVGYEERPEGRFVVVNDPWGPAEVTAPIGATPWQYLRILPAAPAPRSLEPEFAADSDGDRVGDFDEIHRFSTNPNSNDTDGDGIGDFEEIRATVFDPGHGIAPTRSLAARDLDGDGATMELDTDSDDGGCDDGVEDDDRNGEYAEGSETYNFDDTDDACFTLEMQFNGATGTDSITLGYGGQFVVGGDGSLSGRGDGLASGVDSDAPCIDPSADGGARVIRAEIRGSFSFSIGGDYLVGDAPAGRPPQAGDADPELAFEFDVSLPAFTTTLSDQECEIGEENIFTSFLGTFAQNVGWLIGIFEGPLVVPAGAEEIPPFPLSTQMLPGYTGELSVAIERVGAAGG